MDVFQLLIKLIEHFGLIVAGCFILMRFSGFRKIILNPTSCLFIGSGGKLGNFQTVIHVISIGYISG